ncbi:TolC family protein [Brevibacillus thermoruber]|jgi:outer membrane protein TolC|uniref:TolC family protein n=1 Tax=Brevibacillus thermoruber TaxID=33942 RepID=A0A9X3Z2T6_9BACL|nr:TolC family protein [Brevibacillus thermoruber]MDA5108121.1 TolC family protein [Brevibacillus thermoruber]
MNFPYSPKKWLTISLAAIVATSIGAGAMAQSSNDGTASQTPNQTQTQTTPSNQTDKADTSAQPTAQDAAEELTLEKAVEQALKTNPKLQQARLDEKNASVNAELTYDTVAEIPSEFVRSLDAAKQKYVSSAQAKMTEKLNKLAVQTTENQIKLGAQQLYYALLHAQADLELKKQSLERAQTQLKVAKAHFDVGTKAKTDILQAEMGVAGAQAALAAAENNVEIARMKLNEFLGVDLNKKWKLSNDNKQVAAPSMTLQQAQEKALQQRIEITQKQEELNLAELNVKLIEEYSALSTYPGKIARNNVEKAKLAIEEQKRTISREVAEAYYSLNAAKLGIEFKKKAKEAAAESYRLTSLRYENGLATTLEVIQAEEALADQENQYEQAVRDYNLAVVNFETATGK